MSQISLVLIELRLRINKYNTLEGPIRIACSKHRLETGNVSSDNKLLLHEVAWKKRYMATLLPNQALKGLKSIFVQRCVTQPIRHFFLHTDLAVYKLQGDKNKHKTQLAYSSL